MSGHRNAKVYIKSGTITLVERSQAWAYTTIQQQTT